VKRDTFSAIQDAQVSGGGVTLDAAATNDLWVLLNVIAWCFSNDGLIELGEEDDGDRYYVVSRARQKAALSAIATPGLRDVFEQIEPLRDMLKAQAH
jgi:hypothetical protein